jgi:hypothetical protein
MVPKEIPDHHWATFSKTLQRETVVAATQDEDNAFDRWLAGQRRWTHPGPVPAIAAFQP